MNKVIVLVVSVLIAGCATTANYEKILQSWVGDSADSLVESWGPPQSSFKLSNGGQVLEYVNQGTMRVGGYNYTEPQTSYSSGSASAYGSNGEYASGTYSGTTTTYVQRQTPIYNIRLVCITRFTVNLQGIITNWAWQGNNCKARSQN